MKVATKDARGLARLGNAVKGLSLAFALIGIIGGVILAMSTTTSESFTSYGQLGGITTSTSTHPFVAVGIGAVIASVFWMFVLLTLAKLSEVVATMAEPENEVEPEEEREEAQMDRYDDGWKFRP